MPVDPPGADGNTGEGRRTGVDLGPASAYEALTRQMVEQVVDELDEIKGRLNGLLFLVTGAVIVDALTRLAG
jgi:uncharacterized protein YjeT (DUF2065 family)